MKKNGDIVWISWTNRVIYDEYNELFMQGKHDSEMSDLVEKILDLEDKLRDIVEPSGTKPVVPTNQNPKQKGE